MRTTRGSRASMSNSGSGRASGRTTTTSGVASIVAAGRGLADLVAWITSAVYTTRSVPTNPVTTSIPRSGGNRPISPVSPIASRRNTYTCRRRSLARSRVRACRPTNREPRFGDMIHRPGCRNSCSSTFLLRGLSARCLLGPGTRSTAQMMPRTASASQSMRPSSEGRSPARPQHGGLTWMIFRYIWGFNHLRSSPRSSALQGSKHPNPDLATRGASRRERDQRVGLHQGAQVTLDHRTGRTGVPGAVAMRHPGGNEHRHVRRAPDRLVEHRRDLGALQIAPAHHPKEPRPYEQLERHERGQRLVRHPEERPALHGAERDLGAG